MYLSQNDLIRQGGQRHIPSEDSKPEEEILPESQKLPSTSAGLFVR